MGPIATSKKARPWLWPALVAMLIVSRDSLILGVAPSWARALFYEPLTWTMFSGLIVTLAGVRLNSREPRT